MRFKLTIFSLEYVVQGLGDPGIPFYEASEVSRHAQKFLHLSIGGRGRDLRDAL